MGVRRRGRSNKGHALPKLMHKEWGLVYIFPNLWRVRRARPRNKGFARRPQEFLAWEMGGRM